MGKKIFVVTGSPRKNGNSAAMADAFIKGAKEQGNEVVRFDAAFAKLSGCTACNLCWSKNGQACVQEDDFEIFVDGLRAADVIVFAYPLYWSTQPAQLKAAIDRLYSFCTPQCKETLHGKQTALLLCCECEGDENFALVRKVHEGLNEYMQWESVGEVAIHTCFEAGAIKNTDGLTKAYELGSAIH